MKYLKLMNRMNAVTQVPQPPVPQFEKYCKLFVTDEEYDIMMGMKLRGNTEAELRALYTGSDWAGTLYDMCRKGFLLKIYAGSEPTYDLAPMLPGWFEFPLSTGEDSDTIQKGRAVGYDKLRFNQRRSLRVEQRFHAGAVCAVLQLVECK